MKWVATGVVAFLLLMGPMLGILVQPLAPWWLGQRAPVTTAGGAPVDIGALPVGSQPQVSDAERYALALAAGFSALEAITATAISIAEDGSGNPSALSGANHDGSRDFGLWQINSGWWPQFGGIAALAVPINNARAAYAIYQRQNWCAWSTYEARCGVGHTGSYATFMGRAERAANEVKHQ